MSKFQRIYGPFLKRTIPFVVCLILLILLAKAIVLGRDFMNATGLTPVTLIRLALDTGVPLKNEEGRTNILVLGIAGGTHAGSDLTDTMMVLSIDPVKKNMAMISIPRDIWSDTLKDKVNSAYHYGQIILAKIIAREVVGLPIHYTALVDFSGFEDVIDLAGGVSVIVPQAFTDSNFPIAGKEEELCDGDPEYRCRYEAVTFDAGVQQMSGERALMYVRSRHAQGAEGSDFARSRRQQDVMVALKDKLLTAQVYSSPARIKELLAAFDKATQTDLRIGELATVGKIISRIPASQIHRIPLEDELIEAPLWVYGRYALVPKVSWEAIHEYIRLQL